MKVCTSLAVLLGLGLCFSCNQEAMTGDDLEITAPLFACNYEQDREECFLQEIYLGDLCYESLDQTVYLQIATSNLSPIVQHEFLLDSTGVFGPIGYGDFTTMHIVVEGKEITARASILGIASEQSCKVVYTLP